MTTTPTLADRYDAVYAARARSDITARLYAAAMGDAYPAEVADSSSCDWPLLGLMVARLRMQPGQFLVDAACGNGGTGLWLARALGTRLAGFDISGVAVEQATRRREAFGLTRRATFHVADLQSTGLPDGFADGIVCVDAFSFAPDRAASMREMARILAPGARLTVTRALRRGAVPKWEREVPAAGLVIEHVDERPHEPEVWQRLYRLWHEHEAELRAQLGDVETDSMLREADARAESMPGRRAVLLTLRRPPEEPGIRQVADTMTDPGRHPDAGRAHSERIRP